MDNNSINTTLEKLTKIAGAAALQVKGVGSLVNAPININMITREYSKTWKQGDEPYYPVNDEKNNALYAKYAELAAWEEKVIFGGRLGQYKYFDMDKSIAAALHAL